MGAVLLGDYDCRRLMLLLRSLQGAGRAAASATRLRRKLENATVVPASAVPDDVVTLRSRVHVSNLAEGSARTLTLAFPGEARNAEDAISVLAPIGMALLGERSGKVVECVTPEGRIELQIDRVVYQPEAAGDFQA